MQNLSKFERYKAFWQEKAELAETDDQRAECLAQVRSVERTIALLQQSRKLIAESRSLLEETKTSPSASPRPS